MSLRIYFLVELPSVGHRTYVDPTIYDKPEDALTEFTSEINPSTLFLEMMIGGGKPINLTLLFIKNSFLNRMSKTMTMHAVI